MSSFILYGCVLLLVVIIVLISISAQKNWSVTFWDRFSKEYDIKTFNPDQKTVFYIHGFMPDKKLFKKYQEVYKNYNFIVVDWSEGAGMFYLDYEVVCNRIKAVATKVAEKCEEVGLLGRGLKLKKTEMVGHSLGAHIAGLTAEKLSQKTNQKIGVIFGLDPAGPIIKNLPKELRLNETQAEFVVVYHTSRLGIQKKIGHVDILVNGGKNQPGCVPENPSDFISAVLASPCDHAYVHQFHLEKMCKLLN